MESLAINPARVDFVTLRLFCLVAQLGSITKGASRCHLAVSAASRRLTDLESAVGTALLERTAQGIHLTPAGNVALQHALRLCQGFELFGAELSHYTKGFRGHVRLWANMSSLTESLPDALADFMARHPDIKIDVEEQLSTDTVRALVDGLADIGVIAEGNPTHGLTVAPFLRDNLVMVCPADHPLAVLQEVEFSSCLSYPFIGLNRGSSLLELISSTARDAGVPLLLRVQVRSFQAMFRMISAKLGIGVVPSTVCEPLLSSYNLTAVLLTDAWAQRQLLVARSIDRPLSPASQALWQHLCTLTQP
jgi:DNA-binding transcriptional LysR family regulator